MCVQRVKRDETAVGVSTSTVRTYSTSSESPSEEALAGALRNVSVALGSMVSEFAADVERSSVSIVTAFDAVIEVHVEASERPSETITFARVHPDHGFSDVRRSVHVGPAGLPLRAVIRLLAIRPSPLAMRAIERLHRLVAPTVIEPRRTLVRRSYEHTDISPAVLTSPLVHAPGAPALVA